MTEVPAPTPWALIIGSSSGFGEATSLKLARRGVNIFGVHYNRRATLSHVEEVIAAIRPAGSPLQLGRFHTDSCGQAGMAGSYWVR